MEDRQQSVRGGSQIVFMKSPEKSSDDIELAVRVAKLWPNREHEASSPLGLLCRLGLHRWASAEPVCRRPEPKHSSLLLVLKGQG